MKERTCCWKWPMPSVTLVRRCCETLLRDTLVRSSCELVVFKAKVAVRATDHENDFDDDDDDDEEEEDDDDSDDDHHDVMVMVTANKFVIATVVAVDDVTWQWFSWRLWS